MAHLLLPDAAIFSPSVARAAASAAKDWAYIDAWLQRKFPGRGPPPFERNADTLRALLALASANEAADEEKALIARLEAQTLQELRAHEQSQEHQDQAEATPKGNNTINNSTATSTTTLQDARTAILTALESSLTREGQTALDAMAALAVQTGLLPCPTPSSLGAELVSLSAQSATLEQTIARVQTLAAYLAREAEATAKLAAELRGPELRHHDQEHEHGDELSLVGGAGGGEVRAPGAGVGVGGEEAGGGGAEGYNPPANLSIQNLETQRRIRALTAQVPELRDKVAALARSVGGSSSTNSSGTFPSISVEQVRQEEEQYLALLAHKQALDAQVRAFQGLPPDTEQARQELESLRAELRRMTLRRDEVFEGLVERESPKRAPPRR